MTENEKKKDNEFFEFYYRYLTTDTLSRVAWQLAEDDYRRKYGAKKYSNHNVFRVMLSRRLKQQRQRARALPNK